MTDSFYIDLALKEGWKYQGLTLPNPAVGAVVVSKEGKILGVGAHQKAGDPHGEVNALKNSLLNSTTDTNLKKTLEFITSSTKIHKFLIRHSNSLFQDGTIYVTLEPCNHTGKTPPCSLLIKELGFKKVVYSVGDTNKVAKGGGDFLRSSGLEVVGGALEERGKELLEPFALYQKGNFTLFKWAQNLGGGFTGGKISCEESFVNVHKIREKIDLIVVGGNTVRIDRPTLDARLTNGKNPDVLIVSNEKNFDESIPLFKVPNRKVTISSDINLIDSYRYVLIEGGERLYMLFKDKIDWTLTYQSPNGEKGDIVESARVNYLNVEILGEDLKIWGRNLR